MVVALKGTVLANGSEVLRDAEVARFDPQGHELQLESNNDARLLVLTGEPIHEPVVGHGPFVMNSEAEIHQAIADFHNGKFGTLHRQPES